MIKKKLTLINALSLVLLVMGFALANKYFSLLGLACSCGIPIHMIYCFLLYWTSITCGEAYRDRLLIGTFLVGIFFLGWSTGLLYFFPCLVSSFAHVALWECRLPVELILFLGGAVLALRVDWGELLDIPRRESFWRFFVGVLMIGLAGHIVMSLGIVCYYRGLYNYIYGNLIGVVSCLGVVVGLLLLGRYLRLFAIRPLQGRARAVAQGRYFWGYQWLVLFFCGAYLFCNLLLVKFLLLFDEPVTVSLFVYVLTFAFTDVLTELYGDRQAASVVWVGGVLNGVMLGLIYIIGALPFHSSSPGDALLFQRSFNFVSVAVVASMVTYFIAQLLDIYLFSLLFEKTRGRYLWLRNNVATMLSQLVDSIVFCVVAWGLWCWACAGGDRGLSWSSWLALSVREYFWKVVLALLDTPLVYILVTITRNWLGDPEMGRRVTRGRQN